MATAINTSVDSNTIDIFNISKLFELTLILLGVGLSLITFIYSLLYNFSNDSEKFHKIEFTKIAKSISLNIKRMLVTLILLIIILLFKGNGLPWLNLSLELQNNLLSITKLSIFLYLIASVADIVLSTLKLYEVAFDFKDNV